MQWSTSRPCLNNCTKQFKSSTARIMLLCYGLLCSLLSTPCTYKMLWKYHKVIAEVLDPRHYNLKPAFVIYDHFHMTIEAWFMIDELRLGMHNT